MLLTVVPLLGPIGGGLAAGGAAASGTAAGGAAAASSAALTTNLPDRKFLEELQGGLNIIILVVVVLGFVALGVTTNPRAADAILQLAIISDNSFV